MLVKSHITRNSNSPMGNEFFCMFFSVHTGKLVINVSISKIPTKKYRNSLENSLFFSLCVIIHTENSNYSVGLLYYAQEKLTVHSRFRVGAQAFCLGAFQCIANALEKTKILNHTWLFEYPVVSGLPSTWRAIIYVVA